MNSLIIYVNVEKTKSGIGVKSPKFLNLPKSQSQVEIFFLGFDSRVILGGCSGQNFNSVGQKKTFTTVEVEEKEVNQTSYRSRPSRMDTVLSLIQPVSRFRFRFGYALPCTQVVSEFPETF